MKKFITDTSFWDVFPQAQIQVLAVKDIDNRVYEEKDSYFAGLLTDGAKAAEQFLTDGTFSQNKVVDEWRKAFTLFKTKKGARSSIEALLKRVSQGREFHPINPLVDIYNSVSLQYAVPCGGEDLHKISGDLHLGKAGGGEQFLPLGAEEDAPALPGEIIYYDNEGAICRCLNWREAQRTMLTEGTRDAVLVMESVNGEQAARATAAMGEMKQLIDAYFKTESTIHVVTKEDTEVVL